MHLISSFPHISKPNTTTPKKKLLRIRHHDCSSYQLNKKENKRRRGSYIRAKIRLHDHDSSAPGSPPRKQESRQLLIQRKQTIRKKNNRGWLGTQFFSAPTEGNLTRTCVLLRSRPFFLTSGALWLGKDLGSYLKESGFGGGKR